MKGFLPEFQVAARHMDKLLRQLKEYDLPIIGIDPAITLSYREEYKAHLGKERGDYEVLMIHEWIDMNLRIVAQCH